MKLMTRTFRANLMLKRERLTENCDNPSISRVGTRTPDKEYGGAQNAEEYRTEAPPARSHGRGKHGGEPYHDRAQLQCPILRCGNGHNNLLGPGSEENGIQNLLFR
jgi:hypothetical protein